MNTRPFYFGLIFIAIIAILANYLGNNVARFGILNKKHTKSHDDRKRVYPRERSII
ncbi:Uncharacterised protein [Neisseria meningitidis]|nr:Uncharacterised protein [Neisseria meningitidis]SPY05787.1 Uncharacterised protein [Neisseria meningitidis]